MRKSLEPRVQSLEEDLASLRRVVDQLVVAGLGGTAAPATDRAPGLVALLREEAAPDEGDPEQRKRDQEETEAFLKAFRQLHGERSEVADA